MSATFQIPMERRNTMQVENKTSDKYSTKKNSKSCSLKLEAHILRMWVVHIPSKSGEMIEISRGLRLPQTREGVIRFLRKRANTELESLSKK